MIRLCLLVLLFIAKCSFSQELNVINCLSGSNGESLKSKENIDDNSYLLNIRSNSNNGYFPRVDFINDTLNYFPSSWLFRINENGDTLWNRRLPNSENAMYVQYFPGWFGVFPLTMVDFSNNICTKLDDEIILHYGYYDSLSLKINIGDTFNKLTNLITFGVLNINNGNYKTQPFILDTLKLKKLNPNANANLSSCFVNKINDSIYQLAIEYVENELYYFSVLSDIYINFYTVNKNSKSVIKQSYEGYYNKLISVDNRFYILQGSYFTDSSYSINKIKSDGSIELTKSLSTRHKAPDISYINATGNGKLLLGGSQEIDSNATTRNDAVLYNISLSDLSYNVTYYNNYQNNVNSNSSIYPTGVNFGSLSEYDLRIYYNGVNSTTPYCNFSESFQDDSGYIITKNYFTKLDVATGNILWKKDVETSVIDINLDENEIISFNDSTFSAPIFRTIHHNSVQKYDSNFNLIWNTILPDSILIDSIVYCPNSGITDYFPINYNNQFFIALKYIDSSNSNYYLDEWFYFLVSKTNGNLKRIELKHNQIPIAFDSYGKVALTFFNTPDNNLSIIADGLNKCEAASNLDVVIYKYNEVLNAIKSNKYIAKDDFVLFPNPTNNTISIQFNQSQIINNAALKIMDISGRIIYSSILKNELQHTIDVHQFPAGMYFLQIDDAKELHQIKKFQVIH